jgi:hypothetical protein
MEIIRNNLSIKKPSKPSSISSYSIPSLPRRFNIKSIRDDSKNQRLNKLEMAPILTNQIMPNLIPSRTNCSHPKSPIPYMNCLDSHREAPK